MTQRKNRLSPLLAILILAVTITSQSCGSDTNNNPTPVPSPQQPGASTVIVQIQSGASGKTTDAFGTYPLTIQRGQTVQWVNQDSITHTVTSTSGAKSFDSGLLPPGGQYSHQFNDAGTFDYACQIHPNMVGQIVVQ